MSRTDFNFSNNFSNNKNFEHNSEDISNIWKSVDDISSLSFELLLPKSSIISKDEEEQKDPNQNIFEIEDLMMRQNLVDLAIKENATVRENKKNSYVDLLIKRDKDFYTKEFKENISEMTEDDAKFFELIATKQDIYINNSDFSILEDKSGQTTMKDLKFSKSLLNLLEYAYAGNRPIRIDVAKDLSIILRVDQNGRVSAEFIAADKAMEFLIKTNIPKLKQKLDSEGIKYKKIYYKNDDEE